jgi:hypothetical protein
MILLISQMPDVVGAGEASHKIVLVTVKISILFLCIEFCWCVSLIVCSLIAHNMNEQLLQIISVVLSVVCGGLLEEYVVNYMPFISNLVKYVEGL